MKKFSINTIRFIMLIGCLLILNSCKKALDIGASPTVLNGNNVYNSNGTAQAVLSGLLGKFASTGSPYNGNFGFSIQMGLAADELKTYASATSQDVQFYTNTLSSAQVYYWQEMFVELYACNTAISGVSASSQLTPEVKQQLLGEFKFLRAFIYFYMANVYGDVPLTTSTDYKVNNVLSRAPVADVYKQVIQDLKDAQQLLPDGKYLTGTNTTTTERIHPNKQAASALLARVYLYQKDWANAEAQATSVINTSIYVLEPNLNQVFLKGTREAIWQIMPTVPGYNNADAPNLVLTVTPNGLISQYPLSDILLGDFEKKADQTDDDRKINWIGAFNAPASGNIPAKTYYYANKYKNYLTAATNPLTEYAVMLRLAEQYLIRAEARAQQGNTADASADLNKIRLRAGLAATTAVTKDDLLTAIAHENRIELFTEQGHRWFDLRRTGKIDEVMNQVAPQKGTTWASYKQLVPIPAADITVNTNIKQNPGY